MPAAAARRSRGSDQFVSELQRGRLLSATFALVGERGYEGVTARSVSERAGVSTRTFYQCFSDREDCLLAAFNHALEGLEVEVRAGWDSELGWTARVRAALAVLLQALDREPAVRRLVFVEALAAGPRVLARRARVLESLAGVVDEGRANAKAPAALLADPGRSALVAEGVVGGAFGVVHARLLELHPEPLIELLGALMATIVLPYRGSAAAAHELVLPSSTGGQGRSRRPIVAERPLGAASPVDFRLTVRAQMALAAVARRPGLNNREVSEVIGLADQGQISRMMKRLAEQGLVENTQAEAKRLARAWRLTADGEAMIGTHGSLQQARRATGKGGELLANSERRGKRRQIAPVDGGLVNMGFRLTALTYQVLTAVADLSDGETGETGSSNREIAQAAAVKDEGQTSRLLRRLEDHGLLRNTGGHSVGGNAWHLTTSGEQLLAASNAVSQGAAR